jgi:hypothetical protein
MNDLRDLQRSVFAGAGVWTAKDYIYKLLYIQKRRKGFSTTALNQIQNRTLKGAFAETHEPWERNITQSRLFLLCRTALSYLQKPGIKILGGPVRG